MHNHPAIVHGLPYIGLTGGSKSYKDRDQHRASDKIGKETPIINEKEKIGTNHFRKKDSSFH